MAERILEAKKVVIQDAKHAANIQQPERFNATIVSFLRGQQQQNKTKTKQNTDDLSLVSTFSDTLILQPGSLCLSSGRRSKPCHAVLFHFELLSFAQRVALRNCFDHSLELVDVPQSHHRRRDCDKQAIRCQSLQTALIAR
jgi:hypothetical protein